MRLLQVLAGGLYGGAERFYEDLVLGLAKAGLDQACAIRPFPLRAARLSAAGCRVSQFMFGGVFDIFTRMRLAKLAKLEGPDVILGWMNRACAILPEGPWVNVGRLGGYYSLKYYRRCHHLVCNTPDIRDYVIREGWPVERAHYIPNFTPVEEGPPVDRAALDTPKDAKVLLILARLHKVKGIDVAIRALASIPEAILWIAGEGALEDALRDLAEREGVAHRIRFLGWRDDRSALLKAADVCLVPSRFEPFGNVVVNAWAHGVPLVAAASEGPGFLVHEGDDGLKVPVDDAAALANAVNKVLVDSALAGKLRAGGFERVRKEFSEDAVVQRYMDLLATVRR
ncbi:MAG: glycosyltransferase [Proteobacteria bacterium]|nr:glycosyltransferase [Pseudomonadota bacterium]